MSGQQCRCRHSPSWRCCLVRDAWNARSCGGTSPVGATVTSFFVFVAPPVSAFFSFPFFCIFFWAFCAVCPSSGRMVVPVYPLDVVLSGPAAVSPVCFIYKTGRKPVSRKIEELVYVL